MGKSSWIYYAPYQNNIYQAFIDLKRNILAQNWFGAFFSISDNGRLCITDHQQLTWEMSREAYDPFQDPTDREYLAQFDLKYEPHVDDIESLLGQGTGTIVDIASLSLFPQRYAGCTLDEHLIERFYEADERYYISFGKLPFDLAAELLQHDAIWGYVQMYIEMTIQWEQDNPQQPRSLPPQLHAILPSTLSREEVLTFFSQHIPAQRKLIFWISSFLYQAPCNDQTVIWPLSSEHILELFGTSTPTKELAHSLGNHLWDFPLCWYTILYDGDRPSEILFVGASGD